MDEDKRQYKRYEYYQEVIVSTHQGDSHMAVFKNLSPGGALLVSPKSIGPFQNISFTFDPEDGFTSPIMVRAHVVREYKTSELYYWGVEFTHILPRDRGRIRDMQDRMSIL
ncbi:PilZ domain-containing protein [Spirochaeta cellobiosiphila]|uniref:PilZ domain-containing protein n=1 Tax=Spirochaeta cellobiosiphila TaxID=504483 RepID=UPI00146B1C40|nr:PilZ domain-containing protein [Spirochaeta cellobiosiphila]